MKNMQISSQLFFNLIRFHLLEMEEVLPEINKDLEQKIEALARRNYIRNIKLHLPKKSEKMPDRNIWIGWECIGILDGDFFLNCNDGSVARSCK